MSDDEDLAARVAALERGGGPTPGTAGRTRGRPGRTGGGLARGADRSRRGIRHPPGDPPAGEDPDAGESPDSGLAGDDSTDDEGPGANEN